MKPGQFSQSPELAVFMIHTILVQEQYATTGKINGVGSTQTGHCGCCQRGCLMMEVAECISNNLQPAPTTITLSGMLARCVWMISDGEVEDKKQTSRGQR
jgi:hypothetical protein